MALFRSMMWVCETSDTSDILRGQLCLVKGSSHTWSSYYDLVFGWSWTAWDRKLIENVQTWCASPLDKHEFQAAVLSAAKDSRSGKLKLSLVSSLDDALKLFEKYCSYIILISCQIRWKIELKTTNQLFSSSSLGISDTTSHYFCTTCHLNLQLSIASGSFLKGRSFQEQDLQFSTDMSV